MDPLAAAAIEARQYAHAPFSKFLVGAALEQGPMRVFVGGVAAVAGRDDRAVALGVVRDDEPGVLDREPGGSDREL